MSIIRIGVNEHLVVTDRRDQSAYRYVLELPTVGEQVELNRDEVGRLVAILIDYLAPEGTEATDGALDARMESE